MLNKKFIIVANGEFKNESINHSDFDLICACDGGYKYLEKLNIVPDIAIGDFDSLGYVPKCKEVIKLDVNKDETDLFHAISVGINKGYENFEIYGATGKREAHTIANFQILYYLRRLNLKGVLINGLNRYFCLSNETVKLNYKKGYVSIFSFTPKSIVTLENLKYNLNAHKITNYFPLGIDNEFINKEAIIKVISGAVLVIVEPVE